jgi:hypothetical protein
LNAYLTSVTITVYKYPYHYPEPGAKQKESARLFVCSPSQHSYC